VFFLFDIPMECLEEVGLTIFFLFEESCQLIFPLFSLVALCLVSGSNRSQLTFLWFLRCGYCISLSYFFYFVGEMGLGRPLFFSWLGFFFLFLLSIPLGLGVRLLFSRRRSKDAKGGYFYPL